MNILMNICSNKITMFQVLPFKISPLCLILIYRIPSSFISMISHFIQLISLPLLSVKPTLINSSIFVCNGCAVSFDLPLILRFGIGEIVVITSTCEWCIVSHVSFLMRAFGKSVFDSLQFSLFYQLFEICFLCSFKTGDCILNITFLFLLQGWYSILVFIRWA